MAEPTPPASQEEQENASPASPVSIDFPNPSPVLPPYGVIRGSKPKKPPTITPRTFTRFFTPKSLSTSSRPGASRQALRQISASSANSRVRRAPNDASDVSDGGGTAAKRRKLRLTSPAPSIELSSPIRTIHQQSLHLDQDDSSEAEIFEDGSDPGKVGLQFTAIQRARLGPNGHGLSRELYGSPRRNAATRCKGTSKMWQFETANFYSNPEDVYISVKPDGSEHTIPFCATPCNTNSLMAVGDEDGGVRLLESAEEKPEWSTPYLKFRPHQNAVLDISFSPDDLLMLTASGDQTSKVIDMPSQQPTYQLAGHVSSVKQACFQPESSHVIATSSRDGSVQIWDLRCKGMDGPIRELKVPITPTSPRPKAQRMIYARSVNTMFDAHKVRQQALTAPIPTTPSMKTASLKLPFNCDAPSKTESPGRRGDVSVTALQFLSAGREHLLLTGSEANASVKLWDLRTTHNHRRRHCTPLSITRQPESHSKYRQFGLTSLSLSGDGSRLYTLCRDNTVYAYTTSHLILGHAPELSASTKPRRSNGPEKEGLGPLYGLRHPSLHATTFYVKTAIRPAKGENSELLAVGSSDSTPILFPTSSPPHPSQPVHASRPGLRRTLSSGGLEDTIPIHETGTPLVRGHSREVTAVAWANGGELVSVGDDFSVRLWREGGGKARELRKGEEGGKRWGCGWAEVGEGWDDCDG